MRTKLVSLLTLVLFLFSAQTFAQKTNPKPEWSKSPKHKKMMQKSFAEHKDNRENFFTDKQKESIKNFRLETAKKVKPLKNQLNELQAHQQTLTTANNADLKAINKNIEKMAEAKTEIAKILAAQHQQVRSLLTEEQLLKFDARNNKRGQKRGGDFSRTNMKHRNKMHQRRGA